MATISTAVERSGLASGDAETYLRRRRALLVDDDAAIRLICSLNLRGAEFEAAEAADGPRALEQAMRHLPDLVLSDLRMPGLDPSHSPRRFAATSTGRRRWRARWSRVWE